MFFGIYPTPGNSCAHFRGSTTSAFATARLANGQVHVRCRVSTLEVEVAIAPVHPGRGKFEVEIRMKKNTQNLVVFGENEKELVSKNRPGKGYFHQKGEWGGMSSLKFGRIDYCNVLSSWSCIQLVTIVWISFISKSSVMLATEQTQLAMESATSQNLYNSH